MARMTGPAAALLLALLGVGHVLTGLPGAAAQQPSSSGTCGWTSAAAEHHQQCLPALWYGLPSKCPAQAGSGAGAAAAAAASPQVSSSTASSNRSSSSSSSSRDAALEHRQVYIVRFSEYRMLTDLKQLLVEVSVGAVDAAVWGCCCCSAAEQLLHGLGT